MLSCSHIYRANHSCTSYLSPIYLHISSLTMQLHSHMSGLVVFLSTAFLPGLCLQRSGSAEALFYRPVLQHNKTIPTTGSYMLRDYAGQPCIKANMGAQYVVTENKTNWYFSVDPSRVSLSGKCSKDEALLSLMLPDNSACLDFTFRKDENNFYVTKLAAQLFPLPVCKGCPNKTYSGILTNQTLFKAAKDKSFKCTSESLLSVSSELRIKLVRLQMQAFGVPDGKFREEDECWADFNHRAVPIIIGSIATGVLLSIVLSFLIIRDRRAPGYERL
ncbi:lysosome-associated membrane glycoprotein 3 isoform X1 [Poecilia formosa]|uniref:Lysosome-associated membrane glycoprotein 3 n=3 Tax=Poecilia formosa TaxID=48698 RepID=A0A096M2B1_POEFO|nr:PREDICTED: lysosome-associated membrane glycoprotein 3 isoform X1 [Poecilia formosa]